MTTPPPVPVTENPVELMPANGTAMMICGHGSRDHGAVTEFESVARHMRARLPRFDVESGFLEFARPVIREGLEKLKQRGARRILAIPGMLFAATHVKNDLPWEINTFGAENPDIEMRFARELSIDPKLLKAAAARIEEAEAEAGVHGPDVAREDTLLMVVGRGTNDPDANSNVSKVARMLWEGMGFGWAETCYSGVAHPRVDAGLERAMRLGFKRVIVFPYFLFTGILIRRIYEQADAVAARWPEVQTVKAGYLNDHPMVIESFVERVRELLEDQPAAMNCQLCKYREQVVGYEAEVGAVQAGHHHHVQGIGTDADHHHHHGHGHGHGHDHGHHRHDHGHVHPHKSG